VKISNCQSLFRKSLSLYVALFALCSSAAAQQSGKIPLVGYVSGAGTTSGAPSVEAFRKGLKELGYVEGRNIQVEYRYPEGGAEHIRSAVQELIRHKVDILVTAAGGRVAREITTTIPIVMISRGDPVTEGLIDSFARPGGNVTGIARMTTELSGKRLEVLKEAIPKVSRVGILWDANVRSPGIALKEYEFTGAALKLQTVSLEVRSPNPNLEDAFKSAAKHRVHAIVTILNPTLNRYQKNIAALAIKHKLPSLFESATYVESGGLMSYGSDDNANFRRAAYFVDRILKGAKPADLPVEQPKEFELVINLNTAKQISLTIPQKVLARADRVIK
jgi:putative ABC transport system substrate-binding protein